jgi:iron-sulfur cluster assembly protein
MLALSETAVDAIGGILNTPGLPAGSGLRIAMAPSDGAAPAGDLELTVAAVPADGDSVIEELGARVFVQDVIADALEDKLLDANISDEQVSFALAEQPL